MPDERPLERCFSCDDPTGHAGAGDGSLYDELGLGPYCQDCWDKQQAGFIANDGTADDLRRQLAKVLPRGLVRLALAQIVAAEKDNRATILTRALDSEHERCDDLRRELRLHAQKAADEYWTWQGDGEDHLESLTCPVLIPVDKLRDIISAKEQAEAACAAMRQWIDGLQASAPDSLAQYLLAGHPDPPQDGQALLDERDRLRAIADALLRRTSDGVYYAAYDPQESNPPLWAVWRYEELEPWRVSRAHTPTTPDEVSTDFDLLIEDAEDQCVVFGIYSTPEAAEAAKETT